MVKMCRSMLLLVLALALLIPGASAAADGILQEVPKSPKDIVFQGPHGQEVEGQRCATHTPTDFELERNALAVERWRDANGTAFNKSLVTIPVAFHVIRMDDGSCDVPDGQIQDQLDVMNAAYAGYGFQFTIVLIDRFDNSKWSTARPGGPQSNNMKSATHYETASTFNIWLTNMGGGLLGMATFPYMYPEDDYRHGVVALYSTLPGGTAAPYNLGDTITHEAGHYLGLYHTFQGGCTEPNDYCDDTPQEASPAYGCPEGRDSCPADPGLDPIHNFMDYSDDYCMYEFTPDQGARMFEQMDLYRPTIMEGVIIETPPTAMFSGTPTSGEYPLTVEFTDTSSGSPYSWYWDFGDGGFSYEQHPDYTYSDIGLYTVSLMVTNEYGDDTLVRYDYIDVRDQGSVGYSMHVADMDVYRVTNRNKYDIHCDITIYDDGGAPVPSATVDVVITEPISASGTGTTDENGVVYFVLERTKYTDNFCFQVTNVTHATLTYDAGANVVTKSCEDGDAFREASPAKDGIRGITPNPFNPLTKVSFYMDTKGYASVKIYNVRGQVVHTLFDGLASEGLREVTWDARNVASGTYFCRMETGNNVDTKKIMLLK